MTNNLSSLITHICRYLDIPSASIYYTYLGGNYMNIQLYQPSVLESLSLNLDKGGCYTHSIHPHTFDNTRALADNSDIALINHYLEICNVKRQYNRIMADITISHYSYSEYKLYTINGHTYTWCMTLFLSHTEGISIIR